jgi:cytochrome c oxidase cbb3-type subunit 3
MCSVCRSAAHVLLLFASVAALISCRREVRDLHPPNIPEDERQMTSLHAGGSVSPPKTPSGYEDNAYAISQGKQLFTNFNCSTCHAHGGGDIGPALKDDRWIYGSSPAQIYGSIAEGRPNGMPSFRGLIVDEQVWKIVAYVRSLGGLSSSVAAPGRDDDIKALPENMTERQHPENAHP